MLAPPHPYRRPDRRTEPAQGEPWDQLHVAHSLTNAFLVGLPVLRVVVSSVRGFVCRLVRALAIALTATARARASRRRRRSREATRPIEHFLRVLELVDAHERDEAVALGVHVDVDPPAGKNVRVVRGGLCFTKGHLRLVALEVALERFSRRRRQRAKVNARTAKVGLVVHGSSGHVRVRRLDGVNNPGGGNGGGLPDRSVPALVCELVGPVDWCPQIRPRQQQPAANEARAHSAAHAPPP